MNLYQKYVNGGEVIVWNEIYNFDLSQINTYFSDIMRVMEETMCRVRYNIEYIYNYLDENYQYDFSSNKNIIPESEENIKKLINKTKEFGNLPISLEMFYRNIGYVDFTQKGKKIFNLADPLYIESINGIFELTSDGSWEETMAENKEDGEPLYIYISSDIYHKDNQSGGEPYGIELTQDKKVDSFFLNTKYGNLYFIQYLRICFEFGGFPNVTQFNKNYQDYIQVMNNNLKKI